MALFQPNRWFVVWTLGCRPISVAASMRNKKNNNDTWNSSYLPSEFGDELPSNICKKNDITIKVRTSIYTIPQMMTSINSSSSESLTFYLQKHTKEERLRLQMSIVRTILLAPFVQWYQIQNMDWILEQLIKHNAIK